MEYYKISKLLNDSIASKFVTKKWIEVNDLSSGKCFASKNIRFKTSMLRSDLCDFSDAFIVVKGRMSVRSTIKNNTPFRFCISKINNICIYNPEDLDIVMPKYSLLEYSNNYVMTSESLWNYYRDEVNADANENDNANNKINNNKTITSKSFEYKTKIIGRTPNNNNISVAEIVGPLKYLSNFWRSLDLPLINCEIELDLKWIKNCVISEISRTFRAVNPNANPVGYQVETATTGATFQIKNAKIYVSVVTLSINDNVKFLENIKQGFKGTISWNKYRSEITTQPKKQKN